MTMVMPVVAAAGGAVPVIVMGAVVMRMGVTAAAMVILSRG